jgi:Fe2+ transport system protein FeoA
MVMTADQLSQDQLATVVDCHNQQMQEIGFISGEKIQVIAVALFGGSRVVRVGVSTFACRNEELATVEVQIAK